MICCHNEYFSAPYLRIIRAHLVLEKQYIHQKTNSAHVHLILEVQLQSIHFLLHTFMDWMHRIILSLLQTILL